MQSLQQFDTMFSYVQQERMAEAARERLAAQVRSPRQPRTTISQATRPVVARVLMLAAAVRAWPTPARRVSRSC